MGYPPQGMGAVLTAEMVWTYADRRLTNLDDTRAAKIDKIITLEEASVGTHTPSALNTEEDVIELTGLATLEGHIDLSNMQAGDRIVIREYIKLKSGGSYALYADGEYVDAQAEPAVHFVKLPAKYGVKITLEQTAGTIRDFDYNFFKEVTA